MGLWDWVTDNSNTLGNLYSLYDNYQTNKDMRNDISSSNPYGALNAQNARMLGEIYADNGEAFINSEYGQDSVEAYRKGYDRKNSKDRLGEGADLRRGDNELDIRRQIIDDRIAQLQGTPKHNEQAGPNMAEVRDQGSFNESYGVANAIQDIGGIFSGLGGRNNMTSGNFRNRSTGGVNDGWFE